MPRSRFLLVALFILSVLPASLIAAVLAFIGFPFWVAGIVDLLAGNISVSTVLSSPRLDVVLLFISAPMGGFGLLSLWRVYLLWLRKQEIKNPRKSIIGLWCSVFAGLHLLFLKLALFPLALPATVYALVKLRSLPNQGAHGA